MMQLKAKCDLWIAKIILDGKTILAVRSGNEKPKGIWGGFIQMQTDDTLTFVHCDDEDDPYAQLATRYPEWFEFVP